MLAKTTSVENMANPSQDTAEDGQDFQALFKLLREPESFSTVLPSSEKKDSSANPRKFSPAVSPGELPPAEKAKEVLNEEIMNKTLLWFSGELPGFEQVQVFSETISEPIAFVSKEPWQVDLEEAIDDLEDLKENFDGEGSPRIKLENLGAAKQLVQFLHETDGYEVSEVFPTVSAGVELEISERFWEAAILLNDPDEVEFVIKIGVARVSGTAPLEEIPDKLREALGRT